MSKMNAEKKNALSRKLSLNRETLRALTSDRLEEVAGGWPSFVCRTMACPNHSIEIYCGELH